MSDLIDRQAAISAICNACGKIDCDKMDKCEKLQLPPANCSEFPNNSDTISRQAAIDALHKEYRYGADIDRCGLAVALDEIEAIPAADVVQVVRCKECIHHHYESKDIPYCDRIDYGYGWKDNDFCSRGERKRGVKRE